MIENARKTQTSDPSGTLHILHVESTAGADDSICEILSNDPSLRFAMAHFSSFERGEEYLTTAGADAVLVDVSRDGQDGLLKVERMVKVAPRVPIIVLTAFGDDVAAVGAVQRGAQECLSKDRLTQTALVRTILYAIERRRAKSQLEIVQHELEEARVYLQKLAIDPITELLDRRGMEQVLARESDWARREGTDLIVLFIDVDDFRWLNDAWGRANGDVILKEVGKRLKGALRGTDYVGRAGADDFVAFLPDTRFAEAAQVADKVRQALSYSSIYVGNGTVKVSVSIGVLHQVTTSASLDELLDRGRYVVEESRKTAKNRTSVERAPIRQRQQSPEDVQSAVASLRQGGGLHAVTLPIIHLVEQREVGYEFLSRCNIPGFEMPDDFFRISQEADILTRVDQHCLSMCIASSKHLPATARRHLNLFPSTMLEIPVMKLVDAFPFDKVNGIYCIEMSQKQILGDPAHLADSVTRLKRAGLQVAVDDVNFGRHALECLILLEPDIVKIDKGFITGIAGDKSRQRSVQRLQKVAQNLGIQVMAEGIERWEDLTALRDLDIEYGQGYLWGKPPQQLVEVGGGAGRI